MEQDLDTITAYQTWLVHTRADKVLRTVIGNQLEQFDIAMTEWLLLGVVRDADAPGISLSKIAEALDVSQPQVTSLMDRVLGHKLVKQKINRHDRRSRTVMLSTKGKRLMDQIEESIDGYMKTWLSEVSKDQLKAYFDLVVRISKYRAE